MASPRSRQPLISSKKKARAFTVDDPQLWKVRQILDDNDDQYYVEWEDSWITPPEFKYWRDNVDEILEDRGDLIKVKWINSWTDEAGITPDLYLKYHKSIQPIPKGEIKERNEPKYCAEMYKSTEKLTDKNKIEVNELFRDLCTGLGLVENILILDGPELVTTKYLKSAGCTDIHIPNLCSFEAIQRKINMEDWIDVYPHRMFVGKFLRRANEDRKIFQAMWLDYVQTLDGNKYASPKEDIAYLFRKGLLADESILAVTLSPRNASKNMVEHQNFYALFNLVQSEAETGGYAVLDDNDNYNYISYKSVFFCCFHIKRA